MKWPWRGPAISKHSDTAIIKNTITLLTAVVVLVSFSGSALADQFDAQIAAARAAAAEAQTQANNYHAQADTLANKLQAINAQVDALHAQINLNQVRSDQLNTEIADAIAKLASQKDVLGANIKQMYLDSGVSPLEMLASSQNISDFMNKQQYQDKVKTKIQNAMASIVALKASLDTQQKALQGVLAQQNVQKLALASQQREQQDLLAQTQGNEASYQAVATSNNAQMRQLQAAQRAMDARLRASSSNGGYSGSYGQLIYTNWSGNQGACAVDLVYCNQAQDSQIDPWRMYNRECVSYAAWVMSKRHVSQETLSGLGNATDWPGNAAARGIRVDDSPNGNPVVIIPANIIGGVGHAAVVESVNSGWVHVSQYNWGGDGQYSTMDLKIVPGLRFIHF